jgi:hypothetical protein
VASSEPLSDEERALLQAIAAGDEQEGILAEDVVSGLDALGRSVDEEWVERRLADLEGRGLVSRDELDTYLLTAAGWQELV